MFTNNSRKRIDAITGNTVLHRIVMKCKNFKEFKISIQEIDNTIFSKMAKCNNNNNELPIEIIQDRMDIDESLKNKIFNFLLPYTLTTDYKKISDSLNKEKILSRYAKILCPKKFEILKIAYEITEKVRKNIKYSATHPQSNQYSTKELKIIWSKIKKMREESDHEVKKIKTHYLFLAGRITDNESKEELMMELYTQTLKIYHDSASKLGMGDCSEYCLMGCYYAHTLYGLKATVRSLKNGDHVWLEIEDDIYCDIWMGKIFLKEEWWYLRSHKTITASDDKVYNIISPVNYHFQFITYDPFYPIKPVPLQPKISTKLKQFIEEKDAENDNLYYSKNCILL